MKKALFAILVIGIITLANQASAELRKLVFTGVVPDNIAESDYIYHWDGEDPGDTYFVEIVIPELTLDNMPQVTLYTKDRLENFPDGWKENNNILEIKEGKVYIRFASFYVGGSLRYSFDSCGSREYKLVIIYDSNPEPTVVSVSSIKATPKDSKVSINWKTESEIDNAGFNVWRTEGFEKMNKNLIPAQGSPTNGSEYEFLDESVLNRKDYLYLLEDIDLNGVSTVHGPVKATPRWIYGK